MTTLATLSRRSSRKFIVGCLLVILCAGCYPRRSQLQPNIRHVPKEREIASLPGPFPPLLPFERKQDWAREYLIGVQFGKELDLYRAITSFKRALMLLPSEYSDRRQQVEYDIALAYYLGDRYNQVICTVETSSLRQLAPTFPAYRELLLILHESYCEVGNVEMAACMLQQLEANDEDAARTLMLSSALRHGDVATLSTLEQHYSYSELTPLLRRYCCERKSVAKAQLGNALLPGLGYLYVGQKQSAITAALLNGLFIFGAYQFFRSGYWAAGIFTTSLEMGWYFGGIYGAGEAAHFYNERLFERLATPYVCEQRLYPTLMLRWSF